MGNSASKISQYKIVSTYQPDEWTRQYCDSYQELWRNKQSHEIAQIFPLSETPSIQDISRYQVRSNHQYIVKVFNIAIDNNEPVCVTSQHALLLLEYIPIRLSQIQTLELQEAITILHSAFRGFHTLQHLFGVVQPNQGLIGFNEEGKTKVWLNAEFNRNYPSQVPYEANLSNQYVRVNKILSFVEQKVIPNPIFYRLKQELLQEHIFYYEASIVIEEFVFREELSLKRYIRTDLLLRRFNLAPSINQHFLPISHHSRNPTATTLIPTERSIHSPITPVNAPVRHTLKCATSQIIRMDRIQSCEKLDSIRKSIGNVVFQPNQHQTYSRIQNPVMQNSRVHQGFRSIPKIVFHHRQSSTLNNQVKINPPKICFVVPNFQNRVQLLAPTSKCSLVQNKIQPLIKQIKIEEFDNGQKKENISVKQIINIQIPQVKEQNILPQKVEQPLIKQLVSDKSIIEAIQNDDQCKKQKLIEQHQTDIQNQNIVQVNQSIVPIEQVQVSGMFKPINQFQSKQSHTKPYNIIDSNKETNIVSNQSSSFSQTIEITSKKQQPINFESFAANKFGLENMSFAPKHQELRQSQKNFDPFTKQVTSKSLNIEQNVREEPDQEIEGVQQSDSQESITDKKQVARLIESQERVITGHQDESNLTYQQQVKLEFRQVISGQRPSIDSEQNLQDSNRPFYENYTPVESKFDVIIKKDSTLVKQDQGPTYVNIDDEQEYQKYIKNKFKEMFAQDNTVRMNRVVSQYEGNPKNKINQQPIKQTKGQTKHAQIRTANKNKISNIHEQVEDDFLDVKNLEKSLSQKYKQQPSHHKKTHLQDQFDVAKLEEGLLKFSSSKLSNKRDQDNTSKRLEQESVVQPFDPFGTKHTFEEKSSQRHSKNQQLTIKKGKQDKRNQLKQKTTEQNAYTSNLQKQYSFKNTGSDRIQTRNQLANNYMSSTDPYGKYLSSYSSQVPNKYGSNYLSNYESNYGPNYTGFSAKQQGINYGNTYTQNDFNKTKGSKRTTMYCGERYIKVNKERNYPKQADNLLQQRYNKYVKHSNILNKKRSYDSLASAASNNNQLVPQPPIQKDQQMPSFGKKKQQKNKRVSYDNLRALLWN